MMAHGSGDWLIFSQAFCYLGMEQHWISYPKDLGSNPTFLSLLAAAQGAAAQRYSFELAQKMLVS